VARGLTTGTPVVNRGNRHRTLRAGVADDETIGSDSEAIIAGCPFGCDEHFLCTTSPIVVFLLGHGGDEYPSVRELMMSRSPRDETMSGLTIRLVFIHQIGRQVQYNGAEISSN
jgi:hypothetical protein